MYTFISTQVNASSRVIIPVSGNRPTHAVRPAGVFFSRKVAGVESDMLNQITGLKIAVIDPPLGFRFVVVPRGQVPIVHRLLENAGIVHTIPDYLHDRDELIIEVDKLEDAGRVQDVLDSVH
jgi:hypothetical protein